MAASSETLTGLLDKIQRKIDADGGAKSKKLSLDDILEIVGRRAYGPLLVIVGLLSISPLAVIPGSTWLFASLTLVIAVQMVINRKQLWLPHKALEMKFAETKVASALKKVRPWTRFVDRIIRPRLQVLAHEP